MRNNYRLFKRKGSKIWYFYYWEENKQIPKSSGKTLKWQAEEYAKSFMNSLTGNKSPLLGDLLAPYFGEKCPHQQRLLLNNRGMGAEHMRAQGSIIRRYVITHPIAKKEKDKLTRGDMLDFVAYLKNKYGPSLANSIMKAFKTCWKDLLYRGDVLIDIVAGLGEIRYEKEIRGTFTDIECNFFFNSDPSPFPDDRQRITMLLANDAALRRSEITALIWEHIDFKQKIIHIKQAWKDFYRARMGLPKWDKIRDVPMSRRLEKELKLYKKSALNNKPTDFVICWDDGAPISPTTWEGWFENLCKKLDAYIKKETDGQSGFDRHVRNLKPHCFRHTCITRWKEAGIPGELVQLWAGHSEEKTTKIYTHFSDEYMLEKLREKF